MTDQAVTSFFYQRFWRNQTRSPYFLIRLLGLLVLGLAIYFTFSLLGNQLNQSDSLLSYTFGLIWLFFFNWGILARSWLNRQLGNQNILSASASQRLAWLVFKGLVGTTLIGSLILLPLLSNFYQSLTRWELTFTVISSAFFGLALFLVGLALTTLIFGYIRHFILRSLVIIVLVSLWIELIFGSQLGNILIKNILSPSPQTSLLTVMLGLGLSGLALIALESNSRWQITNNQPPRRFLEFLTKQPNLSSSLSGSEILFRANLLRISRDGQLYLRLTLAFLITILALPLAKAAFNQSYLSAALVGLSLSSVIITSALVGQSRSLSSFYRSLPMPPGRYQRAQLFSSLLINIILTGVLILYLNSFYYLNSWPLVSSLLLAVIFSHLSYFSANLAIRSSRPSFLPSLESWAIFLLIALGYLVLTPLSLTALVALWLLAFSGLNWYLRHRYRS